MKRKREHDDDLDNQNPLKRNKTSNDNQEIDLTFTLSATFPQQNKCEIEMEVLNDKVNQEALTKQIKVNNKRKRKYILPHIGIALEKCRGINKFIITLTDKEKKYTFEFDDFVLRYLLAAIGCREEEGKGKKKIAFRWQYYDLNGNLIYQVLNPQHNPFITINRIDYHKILKTNPMNIEGSMIDHLKKVLKNVVNMNLDQKLEGTPNSKDSLTTVMTPNFNDTFGNDQYITNFNGYLENPNLYESNPYGNFENFTQTNRIDTNSLSNINSQYNQFNYFNNGGPNKQTFFSGISNFKILENKETCSSTSLIDERQEQLILLRFIRLNPSLVLKDTDKKIIQSCIEIPLTRDEDKELLTKILEGKELTQDDYHLFDKIIQQKQKNLNACKRRIDKSGKVEVLEEKVKALEKLNGELLVEIGGLNTKLAEKEKEIQYWKSMQSLNGPFNNFLSRENPNFKG